jgi:hypothetical protein
VVSSVTPLVITTFLVVEGIDEILDTKLCGPTATVVISACAPPNHGMVLIAKMGEQLPGARSKRGAGQRIDEASINVEDPSAHVLPSHVSTGIG